MEKNGLDGKFRIKSFALDAILWLFIYALHIPLLAIDFTDTLKHSSIFCVYINQAKTFLSATK